MGVREMRMKTATIYLIRQVLLALLAIAVLAPTGVALAAESGPPAYVIVQENIVNAREFDRYRKAASSSLREHGGKALAVAKSVQILEGKWTGNQTVVIEFPSLAEAKNWYFSPSYQKAIPIRKGATRFSNIVIVEGVEPAPPASSARAGH